MIFKRKNSQKYRNEFLMLCVDMNVSADLVDAMIQCMIGLTDKEKEYNAKQLMKILFFNSDEESILRAILEKFGDKMTKAQKMLNKIEKKKEKEKKK